MAFSLSVIAVGKPAALYAELIVHYQRQLSRFAPTILQHVRQVSARACDPETVMAGEAQYIAGAVPRGAWLVALCDDGLRLDSPGFARWLERRRVAAGPTAFAIGGAYGLSSALRSGCAESLSLSPMTLPHDLALVVLLEQLYRAYTILRHHPYHK
jgi:23S rRNA (pseudouridine1915-N3)-methyltransferase